MTEYGPGESWDMTFSTYTPDEVEYDEHGWAKPMPTEKCLHFPSANCAGHTMPRTSRSGLTHSLKCEGCQQALDKELDKIERRYPDSSTPPSWFDETYAGETWDEDY